MISSVESVTGTGHATGALRRTVSVVFIDIVGFTALVDQLDPEDVWALQKDYFAVVSRAVRAAGGVVEKYIGDAVMAVFATPQRVDTLDGIARDAARAVRAGLRMQQALAGYPLAGRFPVQTRVGVATGPAIVDLDAAGDGGQAMISGSVVATASRLQAYAPHGTVVVCAVTRRVTGALIAYQDLPPVVVAGRPYPVELWRALAPQPASAARAAPTAARAPGCPIAPRGDLPRPDLPRPDLTRPDLTRPDLTRPDLTRPDLTRPDLPRPGAVRPAARADVVFVVARGTGVHARAGPILPTPGSPAGPPVRPDRPPVTPVCRVRLPVRRDRFLFRLRRARSTDVDGLAR